jgi:heterogeneous nuclear ribonucleoprotein F/H
MSGPGGGLSDGGFSDGTGGYSEGGSKRPPRMIESNPYFAVSGVPAPGLIDAYDGTPSRSKRSRTFDPNPYFMGPAFYPTFHGGSLPGGGLPGGGSTAGLYNFPVVRIRGLPFNCDDLDIYKFFSGLDVVDCLFVNKNGRFTGDAYVIFPTPMQAQLALQRDRQNMGHRYVEVFACKKSDYYNAIAAEVRI